MKGMLFRIFKKSPSFLKLLVICLSATPLTKERIEMRITATDSEEHIVTFTEKDGKKYSSFKGEEKKSKKK